MATTVQVSSGVAASLAYVCLHPAFANGLTSSISPIENNYCCEIIVQPNEVEPLLNNKRFYLSRDLLSEYSEFFTIACSGRRSCKTSKSIFVIGHDPSVFSIFETFVLFSDITQSTDLPKVTCRSIIHRKRQHQMRLKKLLECYVLGSFLVAPRFQNAIMDLIISDIKSCYKEIEGKLPWTAEVIDFVYKVTLDHDLLRQVVLHSVLVHAPYNEQYFELSRDISVPASNAFLKGCLDKICDRRPQANKFEKFVSESDDLDHSDHSDHSDESAVSEESDAEFDFCQYHLHRGKPEGYSCSIAEKPVSFHAQKPH